MAEALHNLESSASYFYPGVLLFGGIVLVAAGLCTWLGGLRWAGAIAAFIGGTVGLIFSYSFLSRGTAAVIVSSLATGGFATLLKKPVIVFFGALAAAAVTWLLFSPPAMHSQALRGPSHYMPRDSEYLGAADTAAALKEEMIFWGAALVHSMRHLSPGGWAAGGAAAVVTLGAAFFFGRLVMAATCALLGAIGIFAGMIALLLFKGAAPLSRISGSTAFFALVLSAMIGFGTMSQLLLCPAPRRKTQNRAEHEGGL